MCLGNALVFKSERFKDWKEYDKKEGNPNLVREDFKLSHLNQGCDGQQVIDGEEKCAKTCYDLRKKMVTLKIQFGYTCKELMIKAEVKYSDCSF